MFGMPTLKVNGKAFAGMHGEAMVFKLGPADIQTALSIPDATQFDPKSGRPMREWVTVPAEQSSRWPELAASALRYVGGLATS
jgi:hypothetical protein